MRVLMPEEPMKSDSTTPDHSAAPESPSDRALAAVPVVLTVLATVLAGLSSSEMTRSMYHRSLAAQDQSKASSQWTFFQAKRIRGTTLDANGDLLRALTDVPPLDEERLRSAEEHVEDGFRKAGDTAAADRAKAVRQQLDAFLAQEVTRQQFRYLIGPDLPAEEEHRTDDPFIREVVAKVKTRETEAQTAAIVEKIDPLHLEQAIEQAEANAEAFYKACQPVMDVANRLEPLIVELRRTTIARQDAGESNRGLNEARSAAKDALTSLRAARQDFTARRYSKEAKYNQEAAELYEVRVRRSGVDADRHRNRSKNFFYAMLCAQAGVTVASLALAKSRRSLFWLVAAFAGFVAVSFGAYVYIAM
jgi:hypothetical protein